MDARWNRRARRSTLVTKMRNTYLARIHTDRLELTPAVCEKARRLNELEFIASDRLRASFPPPL